MTDPNWNFKFNKTSASFFHPPWRTQNGLRKFMNHQFRFYIRYGGQDLRWCVRIDGAMQRIRIDLQTKFYFRMETRTFTGTSTTTSVSTDIKTHRSVTKIKGTDVNQEARGWKIFNCATVRKHGPFDGQFASVSPSNESVFAENNSYISARCPRTRTQARRQT